MAQNRYNLRPRPFRIYNDSSSEEEMDPQQPAQAPPQQQPEVHPGAQQPQLQQNNMLALSFRPPSFDGNKTELASRWLKNFNRYADLAGAHARNRCDLMGLMLTGSAETWFNSLPQEQRNNYAGLEQVFRQRYINAEHTRLERQLKTISRQQQSGESVDNYFTDARSRMEEQHFDNELQMTLLINGLRSDLKGLVLQHRPFANVEQLIEKARNIEDSQRSNYSVQNNSYATPLVVNHVKEELFATASDVEKVGRAVEDLAAKMKELAPPTTTYTRRQDVPRCFICGSTSHFKRDCGFNRMERSYYNTPPRRGQPHRGPTGAMNHQRTPRVRFDFSSENRGYNNHQAARPRSRTPSPWRRNPKPSRIPHQGN